MKNLIHLAISMVEMDTGVELSSEERNNMFNRILARIKGFDQEND